MALTLTLTDGTTSYDLLGSAYTAHSRSLSLGNPRGLSSENASIMGFGWDLIQHTFTKRIINMDLLIQAADLATLGTNVQNIQKALRLARQYETTGMGNKWQLKWNPGGSAKDVYFTIKNGSLGVPRLAMTSALLTTSTPNIPRASLVLECDPLGAGDAETVENYAADPGFEVAGTALADHTESKTATGTTARDTTKRIHGNASLKLVMTDATAGQEHVARYQDITVVAAEVWSAGIYCEFTARSNSVAAIVVQVLDSGGNVLWEDDDFLESVSTSGTATFLSRIAITIPTDGVTLRVWYMIRSNIVDATGTAFFDQLTIIKASTIPTTWVSGRDVKNHFDDNGQAHINHIDIHDVLGDYPAKLQLKCSENEAHTAFWAGARHGGESGRQYDTSIWHEGEDFGTWESEPSDANQSGGNYGQFSVEATFDATSGTNQINTGAAALTALSHTVTASKGRLLLVVKVAWRDSATPSTVSGIDYNSVALTKLGSVTNGNTRTDIWYLKAPSTGANDVVVTMSGSGVDYVSIIATSYYGVDQTTPLGAMQSSTGTDDNPTQAVVSVNRDLVVDSVMVAGDTNSQTVVAGAGQTSRSAQQNGGRDSRASTERASGTSTTMSWTVGASTNWTWAQAGVAIKGDAGTAAVPIIFTKSVTTPPVGTYRVLARVRVSANTFGFAMGYAYGGITEDPSVAADYATETSTAFVWLDIGSLEISPTETPDGATVGTLTLRLAVYRTTGTGDDNFDVDAIDLLPEDFGSAYISKTSAADRVVVDSISRHPHHALWNTSDVFQSRPQQEGTPPMVDPDGSRIYLVSDDGAADIDDGWSVAVRVIPQYMVVG